MFYHIASFSRVTFVLSTYIGKSTILAVSPANLAYDASTLPKLGSQLFGSLFS